jgi:hypothetical protein
MGKFFKTPISFSVFCAAAFLAGAALAWIPWHYRAYKIIQHLSVQVKPQRQNSSQYKYINPLLGYDVPGDIKEFDE